MNNHTPKSQDSATNLVKVSFSLNRTVKNKSRDFPALNKNYKPVRFDTRQLEFELKQGYAVCGATFKKPGNRRKENVKTVGFIGFDFDNTTIAQFKESGLESEFNLVVTTPSHGKPEKGDRFRGYRFLEKSIKPSKAEILTRHFVNKYNSILGENAVDGQCVDANRVFYGNDAGETLYIDENYFLPDAEVSIIVAQHAEEEKRKKVSERQRIEQARQDRLKYGVTQDIELEWAICVIEALAKAGIVREPGTSQAFDLKNGKYIEGHLAFLKILTNLTAITGNYSEAHRIYTTYGQGDLSYASYRPTEIKECNGFRELYRLANSLSGVEIELPKEARDFVRNTHAYFSKKKKEKSNSFVGRLKRLHKHIGKNAYRLKGRKKSKITYPQEASSNSSITVEPTPKFKFEPDYRFKESKHHEAISYLLNNTGNKVVVDQSAAGTGKTTGFLTYPDYLSHFEKVDFYTQTVNEFLTPTQLAFVESYNWQVFSGRHGGKKIDDQGKMKTLPLGSPLEDPQDGYIKPSCTRMHIVKAVGEKHVSNGTRDACKTCPDLFACSNSLDTNVAVGFNNGKRRAYNDPTYHSERKLHRKSQKSIVNWHYKENSILTDPVDGIDYSNSLAIIDEAGANLISAISTTITGNIKDVSQLRTILSETDEGLPYISKLRPLMNRVRELCRLSDPEAAKRLKFGIEPAEAMAELRAVAPQLTDQELQYLELLTRPRSAATDSMAENDRDNSLSDMPLQYRDNLIAKDSPEAAAKYTENVVLQFIVPLIKLLNRPEGQAYGSVCFQKGNFVISLRNEASVDRLRNYGKVILSDATALASELREIISWFSSEKPFVIEADDRQDDQTANVSVNIIDEIGHNGANRGNGQKSMTQAIVRKIAQNHSSTTGVVFSYKGQEDDYAEIRQDCSNLKTADFYNESRGTNLYQNDGFLIEAAGFTENITATMQTYSIIYGDAISINDRAIAHYAITPASDARLNGHLLPIGGRFPPVKRTRHNNPDFDRMVKGRQWSISTQTRNRLREIRRPGTDLSVYYLHDNYDLTQPINNFFTPDYFGEDAVHPDELSAYRIEKLLRDAVTNTSKPFPRTQAAIASELGLSQSCVSKNLSKIDHISLYSELFQPLLDNFNSDRNNSPLKGITPPNLALMGLQEVAGIIKEFQESPTLEPLLVFVATCKREQFKQFLEESKMVGIDRLIRATFLAVNLDFCKWWHTGLLKSIDGSKIPDFFFLEPPPDPPPLSA